jgi:hypothetical protein
MDNRTEGRVLWLVAIALAIFGIAAPYKWHEMPDWLTSGAFAIAVLFALLAIWLQFRIVLKAKFGTLKGDRAEPPVQNAAGAKSAVIGGDNNGLVNTGTMYVQAPLTVTAPLPASQDTWINPRQAYLLAAQLKGWDSVTDADGRKRWSIFGLLRQYASDGELLIRGRFVSALKIESGSPMTNIPRDHWQTHDFQGPAYIPNDDENYIRFLGTERDGSNWLSHDRYYDLQIRQSDVERLFGKQS